MTKSAKTSRQFFPPPVSGVDVRIPVSQTPIGNSPFMINFEARNGRLKRRAPHTDIFDTNSTKQGTVVLYDSSGDVKTIIIDANSIKDGTTSTSTPTGLGAKNKSWVEWQGKIHLVGKNLGKTLQLDKSALTTSDGITYTESSTTGPYGITVYRERLYVGDNKKLHYGGVGSTSGAATTLDLSYVFEGSIMGLGVLGGEQGFGLEQLLVAVTHLGEVGVFVGENPGASDWGLLQKVKLPLRNAAVAGLGAENSKHFEIIKYGSDLLIAGKYSAHVYSVASLLNGGKPQQLPGTSILRHLFQGNQSFSRSTAYWEERDALVSVCQFNSTDYPNLISDWSAYTYTHTVSADTLITLIFVNYLDDGHLEVHSASDPNYGNYDSDYGLPGDVHMQCIGNYLVYPCYDGAIRLFDDTAGISQQDHTVRDVKAAVLFAPPSNQNFRNKSVKNMLLYSNVHDNHTVKYGINEDFKTSPVSTLVDANASVADYTTKQTYLSGNSIERAPIIHIEESSSDSTPFEIYGLDVLYEEGGEY